MGDNTDNIFALVQNNFSAAYAVASTVVLDDEEELKNALSKRPRKQEFPEKKMREGSLIIAVPTNAFLMTICQPMQTLLERTLSSRCV